MHVHGPSSTPPPFSDDTALDAETAPTAADSAPAAPAADPRLAAVDRALAQAPRHIDTPSGDPGDAVNIAFVGSRSDLEKAFAAGGWSEAKQGLGSSAEYGERMVRRQVDEDAPVSDRFLFGRKQDVAFERATSVSTRHHVRFWQSG